MDDDVIAVMDEGHAATTENSSGETNTPAGSSEQGQEPSNGPPKTTRPDWWKSISEDPEYVPQEPDQIAKRRQEYRLAIEENSLLLGISSLAMAILKQQRN